VKINKLVVEAVQFEKLSSLPELHIINNHKNRVILTRYVAKAKTIYYILNNFTNAKLITC